MKKTEKFGMFGSLGLAALMFSTYIGPGYASGTQTVSFYLTKGSMGVFLAPVVLGIITFFWCWLTFEFNRVYRPRDYKEQFSMIYRNPVANKFFIFMKELTSFGQLFVVVSAMISGAATLMKNYLGIPMLVGTILFAAAVIVMTMQGTSLVAKVSNVLTIVIIGIVLYITIIGIGPTWEGMKSFVEAGSQPEDYGFTKFYAWFVIINSVANFIAGMNASVPYCRENIHSRKDSIVAAAGNAILCTAATIACTMLFSAGMPAIAEEPLPMVYTLRELVGAGAWVQYLYFVIALAAMLSTGISIIYGMSERWSPVVGAKLLKNSKPAVVRIAVSGTMIIACMLMSSFGILNLIRIGYPILMNIATPVVFMLLFVTIPYRIHKDKKDGVYPGMLPEGQNG